VSRDLRKSLPSLSVFSLSAVGLFAGLALGAGAPPLGVVTAKGSFYLDRSPVAGNATVFEGAVIETGKATSQLRLNNGARMLLAADSRGVVYRDRLVLERGGSQLDRLAGYSVEALTLKIQPAGAGSSARVDVESAHQIRVSALNGPVHVSNQAGVLVARLGAGEALSLGTQAAGASAPSTITGCLESAGGKLTLVDETSSVKFILEGGDAGRHAGNRVEVLGTVKPESADSNIVRVNSIRELSKKCTIKAAAAAGSAADATGKTAGTAGKAAGTAAKTAGAAGKAAGLSVGTKAVIAGVVVAGAATGGAIAAVQSDDSTDISPSGR
jgi:hypothetical protein